MMVRRFCFLPHGYNEVTARDRAECACAHCRECLSYLGHSDTEIEWAHFRATHPRLYEHKWSGFPFRLPSERVR
jgi:hypothetical protein